MWQDIRETLQEYWTPAVISGVLAAIWRWFKPRRLISFMAAVKERETMMAQAEYWKAETEREKESGLRWKVHYDECQKTLAEADAQVANCENRLRALLQRGGSSGQ